jgi:hypothetical protein
MTSGPFQDDREALAASLYHQQGRPRNNEVPTTTLNLADPAAALSGVELGDWDRRIVEWLAGWEPSTVTVVCGLIRRARDAGLPPADVSTIFAALDEAADYKRDRAAGCPDCTDQSCGTCKYRLQTAQAYEDVAARLLQARQAAPAGPSTAASGSPQNPDGEPETGTRQARELEAGA